MTTPGRIALVIALIWSAACLSLAGYTFFHLREVETPERYIALLLGLAMLYMGGSILVGIIWPAKERDPNAPIEIPPLDQVHGRTSYRDDTVWTRNVMLAIGTIFLVVSLTGAPQQPLVLVFALVAVGVLAGAGVKIWRQIQYGRSRLELAGPARRGDLLSGVITTSGSAWQLPDREFNGHVRLKCLRLFRRNSVVVGSSGATIRAMRDGKTITMRFAVTVPIVDTSEGRYNWNLQLETEGPEFSATFLIDVA